MNLPKIPFFRHFVMRGQAFLVDPASIFSAFRAPPHEVDRDASRNSVRRKRATEATQLHCVQCQAYLEGASISAKTERVASTMVCGALYGIM